MEMPWYSLRQVALNGDAPTQCPIKWLSWEMPCPESFQMALERLSWKMPCVMIAWVALNEDAPAQCRIKRLSMEMLWLGCPRAALNGDAPI